MIPVSTGFIQCIVHMQEHILMTLVQRLKVRRAMLSWEGTVLMRMGSTGPPALMYVLKLLHSL